MILTYIAFGLEILGLFIIVILYRFEKEDERKRKNLTTGLFVLLGLVVITIVLILIGWTRTPYRGWVICWHGTSIDEDTGYEFLAAYPEAAVKQGLAFDTPLIAPWDGKLGYYINDSLKACLYQGKWYGGSYTDWFPEVSYIKLDDDNILACQDLPGCSGRSWQLNPNWAPPDYIEKMLKQPKGKSIQIVNYVSFSEKK